MWCHTENSLLIVALIFFSCSKKSDSNTTAKDTTAPAITISSPVNNQIFTAGQTIQITASASDDVKVTELHIHVLNKATGALLRDIHSYPDAKSGIVEDSFTAGAATTYTIKIIAFDPSQNLATALVDVTAN